MPPHCDPLTAALYALCTLRNFYYSAQMCSVFIRYSPLFLRGVPYGPELWPTQPLPGV
jgi:hypothetical protein